MAGDIETASPHAGRGGWSWYTGAAGWLLRAAVESLCGVKLAGGVLRVQPCLPPHWASARVQLQPQGRRVEVLVERAPRGAGKAAPAGYQTLVPGVALPLDESAEPLRLWVPVVEGVAARGVETAAVL